MQRMQRMHDGTLGDVAQPMRRETDDQRRRRELADSLEYAARVARDPEIARRIAEDRAQMAAGGFDPADEIRYEDVLKRLRGEPPTRPES
jgi:hypothetical protein